MHQSHILTLELFFTWYTYTVFIIVLRYICETNFALIIEVDEVEIIISHVL